MIEQTVKIAILDSSNGECAASHHSVRDHDEYDQREAVLFPLLLVDLCGRHHAGELLLLFFGPFASVPSHQIRVVQYKPKGAKGLFFVFLLKQFNSQFLPFNLLSNSLNVSKYMYLF